MCACLADARTRTHSARLCCVSLSPSRHMLDCRTHARTHARSHVRAHTLTPTRYQIVVYPFEPVKTCLTVAPKGKYASTFDCARQLVRTGGMSALYRYTHTDTQSQTRTISLSLRASLPPSFFSLFLPPSLSSSLLLFPSLSPPPPSVRLHSPFLSPPLSLQTNSHANSHGGV